MALDSRFLSPAVSSRNRFGPMQVARFAASIRLPCVPAPAAPPPPPLTLETLALVLSAVGPDVDMLDRVDAVDDADDDSGAMGDVADDVKDDAEDMAGAFVATGEAVLLSVASLTSSAGCAFIEFSATRDRNANKTSSTFRCGVGKENTSNRRISKRRSCLFSSSFF